MVSCFCYACKTPLFLVSFPPAKVGGKSSPPKQRLFCHQGTPQIELHLWEQSQQCYRGCRRNIKSICPCSSSCSAAYLCPQGTAPGAFVLLDTSRLPSLLNIGQLPSMSGTWFWEPEPRGGVHTEYVYMSAFTLDEPELQPCQDSRILCFIMRRQIHGLHKFTGSILLSCHHAHVTQRSDQHAPQKTLPGGDVTRSDTRLIRRGECRRWAGP